MPAFKAAARVREISTTTGTGTYTLSGAPTGFQPFSVLGANNLCPYFATDGTGWEEGIGTVLTAPARLERTTILASSNAGAAVNWGAGTRTLRVGSIGSLGLPRQVNISVAGGANVILTQDQQRHDIIFFSGALTANIEVIVDATPWRWFVTNITTGAFTLTFKIAAGAGVAVRQGDSVCLFSDGATVRLSPSSIDGMVGGTLTGNVTVSKATPELILNKAASGQDNILRGQNGGLTRWQVIPGDAAAETGSDVGSNFAIARHNDSGNGLGTPFAIIRSTGAVIVANLLDLSNTGAGQIKFPPTQNPSADPNTLDDFERGTWTPNVGGTATYTTQSGQYVKISKLIYVRCGLLINLIGTGSQAGILGMAFGSFGFTALAIGSTSSLATAVVSLKASTSGSQIEVSGRTAAATAENTGVIFGNSTYIEIAGTYHTA